MKHPTAVSVVIFIWFSAMWFSGCDESNPVPPVFIPQELRIVELDSVWAYQSPRMQRIAVKMSVFEASADRDMLCLITTPLGSTHHFRMHDDGGYGVWEDALGFADSLTGDASPGDGVYSRRISAKFAAQTGHYLFRFVLENSPPPDTIQAIVNVRESSDPAIVRFSYPDSLPSGADNRNFILETADPEGNLDVSDAELVLFRTTPPRANYAPFSFPRVADSLWAMTSKPEMAVGLSTGTYPLCVRIRDYYHKQHGDWIWGDTTFIFLENRPPRVLDVTGPDTVALPPMGSPDTLVFFYYTRVHDDQTPYDLDSLHVRITREGMTPWEGAYADGHGSPDDVPLDGIFVIGFSVNAGNPDSVLYQLEWIPTDLAGQIGPSYFTHLYIVRDTGNWAREGESALPRRFNRRYPSPFVTSVNKIRIHERAH